MANGSSRKRSATPARKPKPTSPSKSSAKSPMKRASTGGSKPESPKAVGKKNSAGARGADILDQAIDAVTMWGLLSVVALFAAIAVQFDLYTELEPLLTLSSLMMGMGKGGVAGFSTMASAMAAAAAPDGKVAAFLALMVPVTLFSDALVGITYFNDVKWPIVVKFLGGTVVGIFAGMGINSFMDEAMIKQSLGVLFLCVIAWQQYENYLKKQKKALITKKQMESYAFLIPFTIFGGICSYITNNMGPLVNVYLISLELNRYASVGTRSAIFSSINVLKLGMRFYTGDITVDSAMDGVWLGVLACIGVVIAKLWLRNASDELFRFIFEKVTTTVVLVTGSLLAAGVDMKYVVWYLGKGVECIYKYVLVPVMENFV